MDAGRLKGLLQIYGTRLEIRLPNAEWRTLVDDPTSENPDRRELYVEDGEVRCTSWNVNHHNGGHDDVVTFAVDARRVSPGLEAFIEMSVLQRVRSVVCREVEDAWTAQAKLRIERQLKELAK